MLIGSTSTRRKIEIREVRSEKQNQILKTILFDLWSVLEYEGGAIL